MINAAIIIPIFNFDENSKKYLNMIPKDIEIIFLNFNTNLIFLKETKDLKLTNDHLKIFNKKDIDNNTARKYILNISKKNHVYFVDSLKILENTGIIKNDYNEDYIYLYNKFIQKCIENNCFEEYKETIYNDKIHLILSEYEKLPEEYKHDFYKIIKNDFIKIINHEKYLDFICNLNELNKEKFESIIYSNDFEEFKIKLLNAKLTYQNKRLTNEINKLKKDIGTLKN